MKTKILLCTILFTIIPAYNMEARKIKQSLKIKKEENKSKSISIGSDLNKNYKKVSPDTIHYLINLKGDSIKFDGAKIRFSGYEKEASASKETFLITNKSEVAISGAVIEITYYDMQKRMLHKQEVEIKCEVPPGESRKHDILAWDKQHSYYYYKGNVPKKIATPYSVTINSIYFFIPAE